MPKFSWLHLTDLHLGMHGQDHLWPNIREAFFDDLGKLHEKCGPWDVVFFTGDFVQRGSADEFRELDFFLEKIWKHLKELGSDPALLAVPGNHDLFRPEPKLPAVRVLAKWKDNPEIHDEFWTDDGSDYRKVIEDAFCNYKAWCSETPFGNSAGIRPGLLPGDFSANLEYHGLRIGVVGLNTTFLQLTSGDYVGRLAWDPRQFHVACGGDGVEWVRNQNLSILLTHQPPDWLDDQSRSKVFSEIAPAGRFAVHLCGHMHKNLKLAVSTGGGPTRNLWQGCSLFGLEHYGDEKKEDRSHGYSAGLLQVEGRSGHLRHWPRIARFHSQNGWKIIPDHVGYSLNQDEGTPREAVGVLDMAHTSAIQRIQNRKRSHVTDSSTKQGTESGSARGMPLRTSAHDHAELRPYCEAVCKGHGFIRFVEIPFLKETFDIEIDELYVEPRLSSQEIHADTVPEAWPECMSALEALRKNQRVVLLGDPGCGKSTLVSCLAFHLSRPRSAKADRWAEEFAGAVPLLMILRELKLKADLTWEELITAFLNHHIGRLLQTRKRLENLLDDGRAFVLLDGFDEIGNLAVRRKLRDAIHIGMSEHPRARWLLTSRTVGYEQVPCHIMSNRDGQLGLEDERIIHEARPFRTHVCNVFYLAPFTNDQIEKFSSNWYAQHEREPRIIREQAAELVEAIHDNEGTRRLARIPYLLTLMALIHHKNAKLPHGRTELYERIAAAYLESIDVRRELNQLPYSLAQKKRWLADIGYRMQLLRGKPKSGGSKQNILVSKKDIYKWLTVAVKDVGAEKPIDEARLLLDYFARRSGLLLPRGEGQFAFMHLSLQEYFAACFLEPRLTASRFAGAKRVQPTDKQLRAWANDVTWKETFVLLFELLAGKDPRESEGLLRYLFDKRLETDPKREQETAARLLAELTTDPYVTLTAATRRGMRQLCWRWEFAAAAPTDDNFNRSIRRMPREQLTGSVVRTLLHEHRGDLAKAWSAAAISKEELKKSVRHLNLASCQTVEDLSPLSTLEMLSVLILQGCKAISDLKPLARLGGLTVLQLDGCSNVIDIQPLSGLTNLKYLSLSHCTGIENFEPLSSLAGLLSLDLSGCKFPTGLTTSSLRELRELFLEAWNDSQAPSLIGLERLTKLVITGQGSVSDLKPLVHCTTLKELHLHNFHPATDLAPLLELKNLDRLCLAGSRVTVPRQLKEKTTRGVARYSRPKLEQARIRVRRA